MQETSNKNKIIEGRWWKIENKIKKSITAKYHKIKDWVMDPKGYFLIGVDKKKRIKVSLSIADEKKYAVAFVTITL